MGKFTPVKNGLLEGTHRKKMGEAIWLFLKYCQYAGKYLDSTNDNEVCVLIYHKTIQKQLDFNKEEWFSWHKLLENEGYISSHFLPDKDAYAVCIKKPIIFNYKYNI